MAQTPQVIVHLSGDRLTLGVLRAGEMETVRSATVRGITEPAAWAGAVEGAGAVLGAMVEQVGVRGASVCVVYASPTDTAGVFAYPLTLRAPAAGGEALASVREQAKLPPDQGAGDWQVLHVDPHPEGERDGASRRHVLAAVDTDAACEQIERMVEGAGLRVSQCVPEHALMYQGAVDAVLAGDESGTRIVVRLGERSSVLAAATDGRLRAVRPLSVGLSHLVEAIARRVRAAAGDPLVGASPESGGEEPALALLRAHGIPTPDQVIDASRGLSGQTLLPLLMPVLQHLALEVRQTMRFGLGDAERAAARITLTGPGAAVPGLDRVLGQVLGGTTAVVSSPVESALSAQVSAGEAPQRVDLGWRAIPVCRLNLRSRRAEARLTAQRVRTGLTVGTLAALAGVCVLWGVAESEVRTERQHLAAVSSRATEADEAAALAQRARRAEAAWSAVRERLGESLGRRTDHGAVLRELGESLPPEARLTRVEFNAGASGATPDQVRGVIVGYLPANPDVDFAASLSAIVASLAASPVFEGVRLGPTGRARERTQDVHRFELALKAATLAWRWDGPLPSAAGGGGVGRTAGVDPAGGAR
jgi:Tfp pilus assembly PilM family ATPase